MHGKVEFVPIGLYNDDKSVSAGRWYQAHEATGGLFVLLKKLEDEVWTVPERWLALT